MQLVAVTKFGEPHTIAQVVGHKGSEITGPCVFGNRLYFSSQRDPNHGPFTGTGGKTYEITRDFR